MTGGRRLRAAVCALAVVLAAGAAAQDRSGPTDAEAARDAAFADLAEPAVSGEAGADAVADGETAADDAAAGGDPGPMQDGDLRLLGRGIQSMMSCLGDYMAQTRLDTGAGARLIELGRAGEFRERALAMLDPKQPAHAEIAAVDPADAAQVSSIFSILQHELSRTSARVDKSDAVLATSVFGRYLALLTGERCPVDPAFAAAVARADRAALNAAATPLSFATEAVEDDLAQARRCSFAHFTAQQAGEPAQVSAYVGEHGDPAALLADTRALAEALEVAAAIEYLADAEALPPADIVKRAMGVLVAMSEDPQVPPPVRYHAALLQAWHFVRATDDCSLSPASLELIGKE